MTRSNQWTESACAATGRPGVGAEAGPGRRRLVQRRVAESAASAAVSVSFATSAGWETIARWPEWISLVVAFMRVANIRWASGSSA
jgi:hypothetical protein